MRSRKSCYNSAVFRKNLTRFAPAWGLYTLCLVLGVALLYHNGGTLKQYHFGSNLTELIQVMGMINLLYAPLVAQLLFGDLYNSRMCYALHAMPVRRESLFFTNVCSGLAFSVLPTAVMTLVCLPLLRNSCFAYAWQIPLLVFAGINLEYLCFFGIAVLCCMCVGSRFAMTVLYCLLNFGAMIAYWLINTLYTPMLYGVVTPTAPAEKLTPVFRFVNYAFLETDSLFHLRETFGRELTGAVAHFYLTENWPILLLWAAVGLAFLPVALALYRKRNLECAGDAMAFKILEPVFQVLGAVVTAAAAQFFITEFLGFNDQYSYVFLLTGLVVGWFACRMLIERATRVFRIKNWYGLVGLTAAIALSLFLTHVDILGIETWQPKAEDVKSVTFTYNRHVLTDKEDIQKILNLQSEALVSRLEQSGAYTLDENGQWILCQFNGTTSDERRELADQDCRYAFFATVTYTLESGKEVSRRYTLWSDGQAGDDARDILSRWEYINDDTDTIYTNGKEQRISILDDVLNTLDYLYVEGIDRNETLTRTQAEELIAAIRADCEAGNMAQMAYLHRGHFRNPNPEKEDGYSYHPSLHLCLNGERYGWSLDLYPECENTIRWLREQDLLPHLIFENNLCYY